MLNNYVASNEQLSSKCCQPCEFCVFHACLKLQYRLADFQLEWSELFKDFNQKIGKKMRMRTLPFSFEMA